jgi:hypothetical protein
LLSGYRGLKEHEGKIPNESKADLRHALQRLVRLYETLDKKDEASRWRQELTTSGKTDGS